MFTSVVTLALASFVSAQSNGTPVSNPQWMQLVALKSGTDVHQSSLCSTGNNLYLSKILSPIFLTLDEPGFLVDADNRKVTVDPTTGLCSISSTPKQGDITSQFSVSGSTVALSSHGISYSFQACLKNDVYLLYAVGGNMTGPANCIDVRLFEVEVQRGSSGNTVGTPTSSGALSSSTGATITGTGLLLNSTGGPSSSAGSIFTSPGKSNYTLPVLKSSGLGLQSDVTQSSSRNISMSTGSPSLTLGSEQSTSTTGSSNLSSDGSTEAPTSTSDSNSVTRGSTLKSQNTDTSSTQPSNSSATGSNKNGTSGPSHNSSRKKSGRVEILAGFMGLFTFMAFLL